MMISVLAHLILLTTSDPQIETASRIAAELGSKIGISVTVAKNLQEDRLLVNDRGASPQRLLRLVSSSMGASLVKEGGQYAIVRTSQDEARLANEFSLSKRQWIRNWREHMAGYRAKNLDPLDMMGSYSRAEARKESLQVSFQKGGSTLPEAIPPVDLLPVEELLEGIVNRVGEDALTTCPDERITVFENGSSSGAKPLPDVSDLIQRFKEQTAKMPPWGVSGAPLDPSKRLLNPFFKVEQAGTADVSNLRLQVYADPNGLVVRLEGFTDEEKLGFIHGGWIGPTIDRTTPALFLRATGGKPAAHSFEFSPSAKDVLLYVDDAKSKPLPAWYVHPEVNDPLNLFVNEAMAGLSEQITDKPCVINVSDTMWSNVYHCSQHGVLNLDVLKSTLDRWNPYIQIQTDDGVVFRPNDLKANDRYRSDRRALTSFAGSFKTQNHVELKTLCELYHDCGDQSLTLAGTWSYIADTVDPTSVYYCSCSDKFLIMLGSISEAVWDSLPVSSLNTCGSLGLDADLEGLVWSDTSLIAKGNGSDPPLAKHPQEDLPSGSLALLPISISRQESAAVRLDMNGLSSWGTLDQLAASFRLLKDDLTIENGKPKLTLARPDFEARREGLTFATGTQTNYEFKIGLENGMSIVNTITRAPIQTSGTLSYSELPEEIRAAIWKQVVESGFAALNEHYQPVPILSGKTVGTSTP